MEGWRYSETISSLVQTRELEFLQDESSREKRRGDV